MSNSLGWIVRPIAEFWNYHTGDPVLQDLKLTGKPYHTRLLAAEKLNVNNEFTERQNKMYKEPTLSGFLEENWTRFTVLAFAERLFAVRQAYDILKSRLQFSNSTSGALNAIKSRGLVGGVFRGNLLNVLHQSIVFYHPLVLSHGSVANFMVYSLLFEAISYPLDTVKTLVYADVKKTYSSVFNLLAKNIEAEGAGFLYKGITFKLAYSFAFGLNLASVCYDSSLCWITTPLWLAAYPLLTMKTRHQISGSTLSYYDFVKNPETLKVKNAYAGFIPFAAVNLLAAWSFPSLFSDEKKYNVLKEITEKMPTHGFKSERNWAHV